MLTNSGRFKDRNPDIVAAGKLISTGDRAVDCMKCDNNRAVTPDTVKKFLDYFQPNPGQVKIFYGKALDLRTAETLVHGVTSKNSEGASVLVNPKPKTLFAQRMSDKREGIYFSHQQSPLGTMPDQTKNLPDNIDIMEQTFGIPTVREENAGLIINPNKSLAQVEIEAQEGKDLYRKTHYDYEVGESVDRCYDWSRIPKDSKFGVDTPHNNDGIHVKKTLHWLHDAKKEKGGQLVSKRVDDFCERTQPQLGKVHDPIKDTLNVGPDHTFGVMVKPDDYSAGDLMHGRSPSHFLRGKDRERGLVAAVRQNLKKANYHNFQDLTSAFKHYDTDKRGKLSVANMRNACNKFNLPVETELLENLLDYCNVNKDGFINYIEFANFLNWKDKMPLSSSADKNEVTGLLKEEDLVTSPASGESTPRRLQKQIDEALVGHRTSYSMINAVVGDISTADYRTYGIPTIRSDLPAPRVKRISDTRNYGDEADAYGLVNPSIFSNHGVYEKDFFEPHTKDQLKYLFGCIGVKFSEESFDSIWDEAGRRHPKGIVCIESFRTVLDELQAPDTE